jgi:hypothetical protein
MRPRAGAVTEPSTTESVPVSIAEKGVRYLNPDEYPLWDTLVSASPQGSPFCYSWWLNAISPEIRVLGYFEKGRLVAGIPLYVQRRFGTTLCIMPKLTQTWGVVLEVPSGKQVNVINREMQVLRPLAAELKKLPSFFQAFHPSLQNWLPFRWNGFRQTSRVTYVLEGLDDIPSVWKGLSHSIRGQILKATRLGLKVVPCSPQEVYAAQANSYERQGRSCPYDQEYLESLYAAAHEHGAGACFAAKDLEGRIHAANMVVWDQKRAYFLAGGADPHLRASGASSLIVWELIQFSAERARVFDFEGSSVEAIAKFFRAIGAQQVLYSWITKLPFWMNAYMQLSGRL